MQQIKGNVLKARLNFVTEHGGEAALRRVLARLPADDQAALKMITTVRWYPFDLSRRLDEAIVAEVGGGRREFFERLGEASAERNLTSLHASLLSPGDPHAFMARCQAIYALYYEQGRRTYERSGARAGVLTTHGAETFSLADCLTVVGWYRQALKMCNAEEVVVVERLCRARGDDVCRYDVSWSRP